ncbi:MAG: 4'-phosphopantetheinyl transferase superfamily protein [Myxococcota bacterium]
MTCVGLGNDVVDLRDAGVPRARFLHRVLSVEERAWVEETRSPARTWRLWAAKETAYKALVRGKPDLVFAHSQFVVDSQGGWVRHGNDTVCVRWAETNNMVSCVGWTASARGTVHACSRTVSEAMEIRIPLRERELAAGSDARSRAVRLLAKLTLAEVLGVPAEGLDILRRPGTRRMGPPEVWLKGEPRSDVLISLSHDGNVVGCALMVQSDRMSGL